MKTNLKKFMSVALLSVLTSAAYAQVQSETLSVDVDNDIDQMYQSGKSNQSQGSVVTQTVVVPQQSVQKQPVTIVEASPLSDSRADNIRKNRQDEEMRTESRIVEKLEQSRMEDEKKRASVLFGDKFETMQNQQPVHVQTVSQPVEAPASQIQPQPIIIQQNETLTRDAVREEVRAALTEDMTAVTPIVQQKYFAGIAGIAQYPDIKAIQGNYSLGAAFGTRFDYFMVEGAFLFSNYGILGGQYLGQPIFNNSNPIYIADFEMNQYQGLMAAKYQLLGGFVRPVLGGLVSYSYRNYSATTPTTYGPAGTEFGTSHAIDLGVTAGVDLEFNEKMSIGVDMKYMFNMASRIDGSSVGGAALPEKSQYYITSLVARVNF